MKKLKFITSICIFLLCFSCSKDDEEDLALREPFLGRWELIALGAKEDDICLVENHFLDIKWIIEFRPDGTQYNYRRDTYNDFDESRSIYSLYMNFYKVDSKYLYYNYDYDGNAMVETLRRRSDYEYEITDDHLKLHLVQGRKPYVADWPTWYIFQRISGKDELWYNGEPCYEFNDWFL